MKFSTNFKLFASEFNIAHEKIAKRLDTVAFMTKWTILRSCTRVPLLKTNLLSLFECKKGQFILI